MGVYVLKAITIYVRGGGFILERLSGDVFHLGRGFLVH